VNGFSSRLVVAACNCLYLAVAPDSAQSGFELVCCHELLHTRTRIKNAACRTDAQTHRRTDAQTHRRTDAPAPAGDRRGVAPMLRRARGASGDEEALLEGMHALLVRRLQVVHLLNNTKNNNDDQAARRPAGGGARIINTNDIIIIINNDNCDNDNDNTRVARGAGVGAVPNPVCAKALIVGGYEIVEMRMGVTGVARGRYRCST
jgi:hypothetical protein